MKIYVHLEFIQAKIQVGDKCTASSKGYYSKTLYYSRPEGQTNKKTKQLLLYVFTHLFHPILMARVATKIRFSGD